MRPHVILFGAFLASVVGCGRQAGPEVANAQADKVIIAAGIVGTVAQYADMVDADEMLVRGYGVVIGLGDAGSSEIPEEIRKYLVREMHQEGLGWHLSGTAALQPAKLLADKDTAAVLVGGRIPPGAPAGTRFDLQVTALPRSQTLSLDGGVLMKTKLRLALSTAASTVGKARTWALGSGILFVNPFMSATDPAEQVELRSGRIPGGGVVTRPRLPRLEIRQGGYQMAVLIRERINQRFGNGSHVAEAKSNSMIQLHIPPAYRDDYRHFLDLVMHVYLVGGAAEEEQHAKQLVKAMLLPTARHQDISLVWEAMGRQILPAIRPLYASAHPAAAFYAARAGLRLEDPLAMEPMLRIAEQANSPHQMAAIEQLGRARWSLRPIPPLRRMLSDSNDLVRVAAYEALLVHGSTSAIERLAISDNFILDVVDSERHYAIYATQTGRPKIVMFGKKIPIRQPMFYCSANELVTIHAAADKQVMVYRKIPRTGQISDTLRLDPQASELIRKLGSVPEPDENGRIDGLALTYSQVVGVLHDLCEAKHIPADFVLQRPPTLSRMYTSVSPIGRSDMPED